MTAMGQGEGQAQTEGQNGQNGESQGQGPDIGAMVDQLGNVASGMEEMRTFLASAPWQQQEQQDEGEQEGELDLSWLDPQAQTYEDPAAIAARLSEQINGAVDQRAQALVGPMQQQMQEMRRDQQARDLAAEFPELAQEDMANKIAGKGGLAEQMAAQLGHPELAAEPSFWRMTYMAHKAAESANAENGSGDPAARLESGSGPGPASQTTEADIVQGIVNGAGDGLGKRVLDFGR